MMGVPAARSRREQETILETPIQTLIARLDERAHDPKRATDEGHGITSGGKPVVFVAAPPATTAQVAAAEQRLGFALPALLRCAYQEVGDGGFGPGYGLYGLGSAPGDTKASLVGDYGMLRQTQTAPPWPVGLIPLCDWGCGITSYLDCSRPEAPVVRLDPNMPKGDVAERVPAAMHFDKADRLPEACWVESDSLEEWLTAWVDGVPLFYAAYGETGAEDESDDEDDEEADAG